MAMRDGGLHDVVWKALEQCDAELEPVESQTRNYFTNTANDPTVTAGMTIPNSRADCRSGDL